VGFEGPGTCGQLCHGNNNVEIGFITKLQVVYGGGVLFNNLQVPTEHRSPLLVGCSEHLYHLDYVKIQSQIHCMVVCVDVLLIPIVWEHLFIDFLGLRSNTVMNKLLSQILPVNSNFCARRLFADIAGACLLLNFLQTVFALSQNYCF
jgi:hypothetical protein